MNSFINDSISYGISNYILIKQGKDYDKAHIFEADKFYRKIKH